MVKSVAGRIGILVTETRGAVMGNRFSKSELALARRIKAKEDKKFWDRACSPSEPLSTASLDDMKRSILEAPLQPSYDKAPPWWEQAVAEADWDAVWVRGAGWMQQWLWNDILATSENMKKLENGVSDE